MISTESISRARRLLDITSSSRTGLWYCNFKTHDFFLFLQKLQVVMTRDYEYEITTSKRVRQFSPPNGRVNIHFVQSPQFTFTLPTDCCERSPVTQRISIFMELPTLRHCTRQDSYLLTACCSSEMLYTGCHRRNGPNFGRVFLMLNYTDITQNTYVQS